MYLIVLQEYYMVNMKLNISFGIFWARWTTNTLFITLKDGLEDVLLWFCHQGYQTLTHVIYGYGIWWKNMCLMTPRNINDLQYHIHKVIKCITEDVHVYVQYSWSSSMWQFVQITTNIFPST